MPKIKVIILEHILCQDDVRKQEAWFRKNEACLIFLVLGHDLIYSMDRHLLVKYPNYVHQAGHFDIKFRSLNQSIFKKNEAQASFLTLIFLPPCHTVASFFSEPGQVQATLPNVCCKPFIDL